MEGKTTQVWPMTQVLGPPSDEAFAALKAHIAENGVQVPVVVDGEGNVIDGHARVRAMMELRDEGKVVPDYPKDVRAHLKTNAEKRDLAWALNMQRRHLSGEQKRAAIAARLRETPHWTSNRVATLLGVDDKTVESVRIAMLARSEIPNLDYLEGKDGRKYPRHPEREAEKAIRRALRDDTARMRKAITDGARKAAADAGVVREAASKEVAQERKSLRGRAPAVEKATPPASEDEVRAKRISWRDTPRQAGDADPAVRRAKNILVFLRQSLRELSEADPTAVARSVLAGGDAADAEQHALQARRATWWLERFAADLEEGYGPLLRGAD